LKTSPLKTKKEKKQMNKIKKKIQTCEPEWPSVREPQQKKA
jgi:hypothetical protein